MVMASHMERGLEIESTMVHVVYDAKTGVIAHVHRIVTHRGATKTSKEEAESRALEMAGRFGHIAKDLAVLRADGFDRSKPQRVDVKTSKIITQESAGTQRSDKSPRSEKAKKR
jgi:hypothetical protein